MRYVGVDLGGRRVGLAVSDRGGVLASPRRVVELAGASTRAGDAGAAGAGAAGAGAADADLRLVVAAIVEELPEVVVVGVPVSMDGREREPAAAARAMAERLRAALDVPVETYDERLTTVLASRLRRSAAGSGRQGRGGSGRRPIDAEAAAVMLQSFLDARAAAGR